jgi:hypothetical protein
MQLYVSNPSAVPSHLQHHLYRAYKDTLLKCLLQKTTSPLHKAHLLSLSNPGAMLWTHLDIRRDDLRLSNQTFNNCVRMALALQPSQAISADPHAKCCCGFLLRLDPLHFYACAKFRNLENGGGYGRHQDVTGVLQAHSDRAGFLTHTEHQFFDKGGRRADLSLLDPLTNSLTHIDVSVVLSSAESYRAAASRQPLSAANSRVHAKETKYADLCRKEGAYFSPFILETTGAMSKPALQMISRIADQSAATNPYNPITAAQLTQRVAIALHNGNAQIVHQGLARSAQAFRPHAGR